MRVKTTERGFPTIVHPKYASDEGETRLVQQSSAIGDYADSFDKPGSSYLWLGDDHHLNREEVRELIRHLSKWCATGRFLDE